jgi:glycosyltransferase involved in cell wall biosynthesis
MALCSRPPSHAASTVPSNANITGTMAAPGLQWRACNGGHAMIQRPWLSAVIPSHNGERWLAGALQSVVSQGDRGIEVILVDSSDSETSCEIAERFGDRLCLRIFRRPDLLSWTAKTNFAVGAAAADWICMLHQDDVWLPGRCAAISGWLAATPGGVMHLHAAEVISAAGKRLGQWRCPLPAGAAPVPSQLLLQRLLIQNFVAITAPTIRRETYLRAGGLDEPLWYTADWDLYLKVIGTGNIYYHSETLAGFRIHGNSLTMSGSRGIDDFRRQMEIVLDRHIGKLAACREQELRLARASIDVNVALAALNNGKPGRIVPALAQLLALGPRQILRYMHDSRIIERVGPRLRARLARRL